MAQRKQPKKSIRKEKDSSSAEHAEPREGSSRWLDSEARPRLQAADSLAEMEPFAMLELVRNKPVECLSLLYRQRTQIDVNGVRALMGLSEGEQLQQLAGTTVQEWCQTLLSQGGEPLEALIELAAGLVAELNALDIPPECHPDFILHCCALFEQRLSDIHFPSWLDSVCEQLRPLVKSNDARQIEALGKRLMADPVLGPVLSETQGKNTKQVAHLLLSQLEGDQRERGQLPAGIRPAYEEAQGGIRAFWQDNFGQAGEFSTYIQAYENISRPREALQQRALDISLMAAQSVDFGMDLEELRILTFVAQGHDAEQMITELGQGAISRDEQQALRARFDEAMRLFSDPKSVRPFRRVSELYTMFKTRKSYSSDLIVVIALLHQITKMAEQSQFMQDSVQNGEPQLTIRTVGDQAPMVVESALGMVMMNQLLISLGVGLHELRARILSLRQRVSQREELTVPDGDLLRCFQSLVISRLDCTIKAMVSNDPVESSWIEEALPGVDSPLIADLAAAIPKSTFTDVSLRAALAQALNRYISPKNDGIGPMEALFCDHLGAAVPSLSLSWYRAREHLIEAILSQPRQEEEAGAGNEKKQKDIPFESIWRKHQSHTERWRQEIWNRDMLELFDDLYARPALQDTTTELEARLVMLATLKGLYQKVLQAFAYQPELGGVAADINAAMLRSIGEDLLMAAHWRRIFKRFGPTPARGNESPIPSAVALIHTQATQEPITGCQTIVQLTDGVLDLFWLYASAHTGPQYPLGSAKGYWEHPLRLQDAEPHDNQESIWIADTPVIKGPMYWSAVGSIQSAAAERELQSASYLPVLASGVVASEQAEIAAQEAVEKPYLDALGEITPLVERWQGVIRHRASRAVEDYLRFAAPIEPIQNWRPKQLEEKLAAMEQRLDLSGDITPSVGVTIWMDWLNSLCSGDGAHRVELVAALSSVPKSVQQFFELWMQRVDVMVNRDILALSELLTHQAVPDTFADRAGKLEAQLWQYEAAILSEPILSIPLEETSALSKVEVESLLCRIEKLIQQSDVTAGIYTGIITALQDAKKALRAVDTDLTNILSLESRVAVAKAELGPETGVRMLLVEEYLSLIGRMARILRICLPVRTIRLRSSAGGISPAAPAPFADSFHIAQLWEVLEKIADAEMAAIWKGDDKLVSSLRNMLIEFLSVGESQAAATNFVKDMPPEFVLELLLDHMRSLQNQSTDDRQ